MTMQERCAPKITAQCGRGFDSNKVALALVCHCGAKHYTDIHDDWCPVETRKRKRQRDAIHNRKHEHIELEVA